MKQFFKYMFASMLGFSLALGLATLLMFVFIFGAIMSSDSDKKKVKIAENSILELKLNKQIRDQSDDNPFENFDFGSFENNAPLSLRDIIISIEKAKSDDRIKGIYIQIPYLQASFANTEEIRAALVSFKESGKFIVSYSENYSQNEFYLTSVADEIYLNPSGDLSFDGLSAQLMFFKDALSRLEIDMQVIRHGKFKSAIEPYIREDMSEENRKQLKSLIHSIWDYQLATISKDRNISVDMLNEIADSLKIRTAEDALEQGLVDGLKYEDEVAEILKEKLGIEADDKLHLASLKDLRKTSSSKSEGDKEEANDNTEESTDSTAVAVEKINSKNKIALIFAEGEIVSGESRNNIMGSETIAKAIKDARTDDKVKAIVLRVNSPGGSALASDVIWREANLAKDEKPFVVSMGSAAASGGYYISCAADKIFAENSTITGSIGVFGLIPNIQGMMNNKLGITFDHVNTNEYSDGLTTFRPMAKVEKEAIQEAIEDIYDDFTSRVAEGRNMTQAEVDSIGQGRVWTGILAKEIGLVDEIGGLNDAIDEAIKMAEVSDYKIKKLPAKKDVYKKLLEEFGAEVKIEFMGEELGEAEKYYSNMKKALSSKGVYTRLPVDIIIE